MSDILKVKATLMWASLARVNQTSDKYQVDLCQLSDAAVEAIEDAGCEVNEDDEKGYFITCKSERPIRALDIDGAEIDGLTVGNGSQAVARINPYDWTYKRKKGVSFGIKKLTVTDLEIYDGDDFDDDEDDNLDEAL